jgi:glycosyltransferase involved in cell wall biosynthesis
MKEKTLITIYIPCHNYAHYLNQAVESVLAQSYQEWELFIIDDGSSDDTLEIAQQLKEKCADRITIICNETPQGLQRSANRILELARGEYILRLDADDWLDESALLIMVQRMLDDPSLGLIFGSYYYVDSDGNVIGIEKQHKLWDEDKSGLNPPHGACTLVRTRSLKAVGGYSEDVNAQDGWELWFKLVNRIRSASIDTPLFYYRQHSTSLSRNEKKLYNARAQIFSKLREKMEGSYKPNILAVIPVRESYPHFKEIPYTSLGHKTLLEHVISVVQEVEGISDILLSTDNEGVISYTERLIADGKVEPLTFVQRPPELAGDFISIQQILKHSGLEYRKKTGNQPDVMMFLSLHAPLRDAKSITKALNVLLVTESDTVVSVVEEREPIFMHSENGLSLIGTGRFDGLLHKREQVFKFNGNTIAAWWDVIENGTVWGEKIGYVEMTQEDSTQLTSSHALHRVLEIMEQREGTEEKTKPDYPSNSANRI